jgi:outer membrane protein
MRLSFAALALATALPLSGETASAQQRPDSTGPILTIDEALRLAVRNNPTHQATLNDRSTAAAAVRAAYGRLLPGSDLFFQTSFREGGVQTFQGIDFPSSGQRSAFYQIGLDYQLSMSNLLGPKVEKARRDAVEADITGSEQTVRTTITQQYLTALQAEANAGLQDSLVGTAQAQLELATLKLQVGSGTQLDVRRAEVTLGQQRVAALQAHNTAEVEKLRLFQQMGVDQPPNVRLATTFEMREPNMSVDQMLAMANRQNPQLLALRARDKAAGASVQQARAQYLPTLSISTGWSGFAREASDLQLLEQNAIADAQAQANSLRSRCFNTDSIRSGAGLPARTSPISPGLPLACDEIVFSPAIASAIRSQIRADNQAFPFGFETQPRALNFSLSLPLFNGFQREQQVQVAQAQRNDARFLARARELQLKQEVSAAYMTLTTARRTIELQEQNAATAREELRLAEERYKVGAATFLEVTTARDSFQRAEQARITAIFDYHRAFAALENAVGRPLR